VVGKKIADDKAFEAEWLKTRAAKLETAGMPAIYR
jgi:hypothetical protein